LELEKVYLDWQLRKESRPGVLIVAYE
jgi:hypothetical protein